MEPANFLRETGKLALPEIARNRSSPPVASNLNVGSAPAVRDAPANSERNKIGSLVSDDDFGSGGHLLRLKYTLAPPLTRSPGYDHGSLRVERCRKSGRRDSLATSGSSAERATMHCVGRLPATGAGEKSREKAAVDLRVGQVSVLTLLLRIPRKRLRSINGDDKCHFSRRPRD
jgi:hypothetical protein